MKINYKKCRHCEKVYKESDFHWKIKKQGVRSNKCKTCTNQYSKAHYELHKHDYIERSRENTKKYREDGRNLIYEFKLSNPCTSCGEANPIVLEFHHLDPKQKRNDVSNMATHGYSIESIEQDIKKFFILCATCHRHTTATAHNWHSHKLRQRRNTWEEP